MSCLNKGTDLFDKEGNFYRMKKHLKCGGFAEMSESQVAVMRIVDLFLIQFFSGDWKLENFVCAGCRLVRS